MTFQKVCNFTKLNMLDWGSKFQAKLLKSYQKTWNKTLKFKAKKGNGQKLAFM